MLLAGPLIDDQNAVQGGYYHASPAGDPPVTFRAAALRLARTHGVALRATLGVCNDTMGGGWRCRLGGWGERENGMIIDV